MNNAFGATVHGGRGIGRVDAMSSGFGQIYLHAVVVNIVVYGACSVASASYTGNEVVGVGASHLFLQLPFQFLRYYALHLIEGVLRMAAPVAYGF